MNRWLKMEKPMYQYAKSNFPLLHRGQEARQEGFWSPMQAQLLLAALVARAAGCVRLW